MAGTAIPRTAGELIERILLDRLVRFTQLGPSALADEYDAVHQWRTSTRRLRSLLDSFRSALDPERAAVLQSELTALGTVLGRARDLEVRIAQLDELPLRQRDRQLLQDPLHADHEVAHRQIQEWWTGPQGRALDDTVAQWRRGVPLGEGKDEPSRPWAEGVVRAQLGRTRRTDVGELRDSDDAHRLRKRARHLRYVCEAVSRGDTVLLGKPTRRLAKASSAVQSALGERHDVDLLRELLRDREVDMPLPEYDDEAAARAVNDLRAAMDAWLAAPVGWTSPR